MSAPSPAANPEGFPRPRHRLDRAGAERLRNMLSELQRGILFDGLEMPDAVRDELVKRISEQGFALVDELQGVIR